MQITVLTENSDWGDVIYKVIFLRVVQKAGFVIWGVAYWSVRHQGVLDCICWVVFCCVPSPFIRCDCDRRSLCLRAVLHPIEWELLSGRGTWSDSSELQKKERAASTFFMTPFNYIASFRVLCCFLWPLGRRKTTNWLKCVKQILYFMKFRVFYVGFPPHVLCGGCKMLYQHYVNFCKHWMCLIGFLLPPFSFPPLLIYL